MHDISRPATIPDMGTCLALIKFRLLSLVLVSTCMGFFLASDGTAPLPVLAYTVLGVLLVGGGANALNQWKERDIDALMLRTQKRPLVAGRITAPATLLFGLTITLLGLLLLGALVNPLTLALSFLSWFSYLFVYTPLKTRTPLNTWIGAVPGALPAMLGCTAATASLDTTALSLFLLLYVWQIPHFLAISWVYRDDYLRGGFRMLSRNDTSGRRTAQQILLHSLLLLPVSAWLAPAAGLGAAYITLALCAGLPLLYYSAAFCRHPDRPAALKLFHYSIAYLPLLLPGIVLDRLLTLWT